jgi:hypothetical protein
MEISKANMYDMHYTHMKGFYGDRAKLIYTDTDSLIYHLETKDMFDGMKSMGGCFDMSEYDAGHPQFGKFLDRTNEKVLGKFKDEYHYSIITHVAAVPEACTLFVVK